MAGNDVVLNINCVVHKDIEPGVINNEMLLKMINEQGMVLRSSAMRSSQYNLLELTSACTRLWKIPVIIDPVTIRRIKKVQHLYIYTQGPTEEAGRLFIEDGITFEEVTHIRVEFQNIIKIDHLWMLTSLTKLTLSNNLIEDIENIDMLVNLTELDMSFNYIAKMDNLETLVNLEILILYQNKIKIIENIGSLKGLIILNLGRNEVREWDSNILYLRQFHKLRSLNLGGCPCSEEEGFREFIAGFMPELKYYDFKLIRQEEREAAVTMHSRKLEELADREQERQELEDKEVAEEADTIFYSVSYVEHLSGHQLFESLFVNDPEGTAFLEMGEEMTELMETYKEEMYRCTQQIFLFGQEQHEVRVEEIRQFELCVKEAKDRNQKESQDAMDAFMVKKADLFEQLSKVMISLTEEGDVAIAEYLPIIDSINDEFNELVQTTWTDLMETELVLYESMEEVNATFGLVMEEMVNTFVESAQNLFVQCRDAEVHFSGEMSDIAQRFMTKVQAEGADKKKMSKALRAALVDKDAIANAVAGSHDVHMQLIDAREDLLISRIRGWLEEEVETLGKKEIERDRAKILEINHYLDIQREEFESAQVTIVPQQDADDDLIL